MICSDCNQVSVTFEPFMYLSVPIPHAMERQLCKSTLLLYLKDFCHLTLPGAVAQSVARPLGM